MATNGYSIVIRSDSRGMTAAGVYNAGASTFAISDPRLSFEIGEDYYAILIDGDYALIYDTDGLVAGDFLPMLVQMDFPRLDIYKRLPLGINTLCASISKQGRIYARSLSESDTLPSDALVLFGHVAFNVEGVTANKVNEMHALASGGKYLTYEGKLIRVRI